MTESNENAGNSETTNGKFVMIDQKIFGTSSRDRLMSWKAGGGRINIDGQFKATASTQDNVDLPKGTYLAVEATKFKCVYK
ncbi:hypothetical protein QWA68_015030 [Fusarium oxysporum]|nr:hypothetical protein QWA68_015030 [Fusarium oxysporum]